MQSNLSGNERLLFCVLIEPGNNSFPIDLVTLINYKIHL